MHLLLITLLSLSLLWVSFLFFSFLHLFSVPLAFIVVRVRIVAVHHIWRNVVLHHPLMCLADGITWFSVLIFKDLVFGFDERLCIIKWFDTLLWFIGVSHFVKNVSCKCWAIGSPLLALSHNIIFAQGLRVIQLFEYFLYLFVRFSEIAIVIHKIARQKVVVEVLIDFSRLEPSLLLLLSEGYVLDTIRYASLLPYFVRIESLTLPELLSRLLLLIYYIIWLIFFIFWFRLFFSLRSFAIMLDFSFFDFRSVLLLLSFCVFDVLFDLIFLGKRVFFLDWFPGRRKLHEGVNKSIEVFQLFSSLGFEIVRVWLGRF